MDFAEAQRIVLARMRQVLNAVESGELELLQAKLAYRWDGGWEVELKAKPQFDPHTLAEAYKLTEDAAQAAPCSEADLLQQMERLATGR